MSDHPVNIRGLVCIIHKILLLIICVFYLGRYVCTLLEGLEAILHAKKLWRVQQLLFVTLWQRAAHTQDG